MLICGLWNAELKEFYVQGCLCYCKFVCFVGIVGLLWVPLNLLVSVTAIQKMKHLVLLTLYRM
jgi:hypothetical protein